MFLKGVYHVNWMWRASSQAREETPRLHEVPEGPGGFRRPQELQGDQEGKQRAETKCKTEVPVLRTGVFMCSLLGDLSGNSLYLASGFLQGALGSFREL